MQVPPPQAMLKELTAISIGALSVELVGVAKFGLSLYIRKVLSVSKVKKYPGEPSGGSVGPSTSDGRKLPSPEIVYMIPTGDAAPASIAVRSYASSAAPTKLKPLANRFAVLR